MPNEYIVEIEKLPLSEPSLPPEAQGATLAPAKSFATITSAEPYLEQLVQEGYRLRVICPHRLMSHEDVLTWLNGMLLERLRRQENAERLNGSVRRNGDRLLASCDGELNYRSGVDEEIPLQQLESAAPPEVRACYP